MPTYTSEEKAIMYDYILKQFSTPNASVDTVYNDAENDISVLRISTNEHYIYVTLGASFHQINNKVRKDMMQFEMIMLASKSITDNQEKAIVEQLPHFVTSYKEKNQHLGELHTIDWITEINANCFKYPTFMLLQASPALEINKNTIHFMISLPLLEDEINWIDRLQELELLLFKNIERISRKYVGCFLSCYSQMFFDKKYFYVNEPRNKPCLNLRDNYHLSSIDDACRNVAWGKILELSRKLGSLPFETYRAKLIPKSTKSNTKRNWKFEEIKGKITLTRYFGDEAEVIVPDNINNMSVSSIAAGAFSPVRCNGRTYSKANEALMTLKKVVLPNSITEIPPELFMGCSCLEEIILPENITSIGPRAFLDCNSIKTTEYHNGRYLGTEENPYYALIGALPNVADITIHPSTNVIQKDALLNRYNKKLRLVFVPEKLKSYFNETIDAYNFKVKYF